MKSSDLCLHCSEESQDNNLCVWKCHTLEYNVYIDVDGYAILKPAGYETPTIPFTTQVTPPNNELRCKQIDFKHAPPHVSDMALTALISRRHRFRALDYPTWTESKTPACIILSTRCRSSNTQASDQSTSPILGRNSTQLVGKFEISQLFPSHPITKM